MEEYRGVEYSFYGKEEPFLTTKEIIQNLETSGVNFSTFRSVLHATERVLKIFAPSQEKGVFSQLTELTPSIVDDCKYYQKREDINEENVIGVLHAIQLFSLTQYTDILGDMEAELFTRSILKNISNNLGDTYVTFFSFLKHKIRVQLFWEDVYREKNEVVYEQIRRRKDGENISIDQIPELGEIDPGYEEVETSDAQPKDVVLAILRQIAQLNTKEEREIIAAKLARNNEVLSLYRPETITQALASFYALAYNAKIVPSFLEHKKQATYPEWQSMQYFQEIMQKIGSLKNLFLHLQRFPHTNEKEALELATLLHFLGYYHPDESTELFAINEGSSYSHIQKTLQQSIQKLAATSAVRSSSTPNLSRVLKNLERSAVERRGEEERFKMPIGLPNKVLFLSRYIKQHPERTLARIINPLQIALLRILEQHPEDSQWDLQQIVGEFYEKTKEIRKNSSRELFIESVHRSILRLLDPKVVNTHGRRISKDYIQSYIIGKDLSPQQKALVESRPELRDTYIYLTQANDMGQYNLGSTAIGKRIHHHKRVIGYLSAVFDMGSLDQVYKNNKILTMQIIGMRMELSPEIFIDPEKIQEIVDVLRERCKGNKISEIARQLNCSKKLIQEILKLDIEKTLFFYNKMRVLRRIQDKHTVHED